MKKFSILAVLAMSFVFFACSSTSKNGSGKNVQRSIAHEDSHPHPHLEGYRCENICEKRLLDLSCAKPRRVCGVNFTCSISCSKRATFGNACVENKTTCYDENGFEM